MPKKVENVTEFGGQPIAEIRKKVEAVITKGTGAITVINPIDEDGKNGLDIMSVGSQVSKMKMAVGYMSLIKALELDSDDAHKVLHKVYSAESVDNNAKMSDPDNVKKPNIEDLREIVGLLEKIMPKKKGFFARVFGK